MTVQTIKSLARRPWYGSPRTADTRYEPPSSEPDIGKAVCFNLSDGAT